jgi:prepilin-type N-terminal cleavage/methylation domain-containing protein
MKKHNKGFTLIELLVVIAIIGILASVVLVSINSARVKAKDSHIISSIQQLRTQVESEYTFNYNSSFTATAGTINLGNSSPNYNILFSDIHNYTASSSASTTRVAGFTFSGWVGAYPELIAVYPSGVTASGANISGIINAYALYGKLSQGTGTFFCLDSTGNSLQNDYTISPLTITCTP